MSPISRTLLAANLRRLRHGRGWSQEQLAERCGLHRTYIGAIERGERNVSLDSLDRLARGLHIPVSVLLDIAADWTDGVREPATCYRVSAETACRRYQAFCYS